MRQRTANCLPAVILLMSLFSAASAQAVPVTVMVDDGKAPLADAVVSVHSTGAATPVTPGKAVMDQRGMLFAPTVLAVTVGTLVRFPNSDNIRHQVYSFSPAKHFELPLYAGIPADPVQFDQAGVVTLGCNIHDWMVGYIVVLDTPYFAKTGIDGRAHLDVPAGTYQLRAWHPQLAGEPRNEALAVAGTTPLEHGVHLNLLAQPPRSAEQRMRMNMKKKQSKTHPYH